MPSGVPAVPPDQRRPCARWRRKGVERRPPVLCKGPGMDTQTSLMIFQLTCCLGFALWLSLALINNLQAFASARWA
ncbi:hypothetical protein ACLBVL_24560, partial [Pseudomonas aeruginosa]